MGGDEVHDRFGLDEVDASVEEGAAGELPGLGGTGPGIEDGTQDASSALVASVTLELDDVLPRVGGRPPEEKTEGFVYPFAPGVHLSVGEGSGRAPRHRPPGAMEDPVGDGPGIRHSWLQDHE